MSAKIKICDSLLKRLGWEDYQISNVDEGMSTDVYKLVKNKDIFFLRIMPEGENASSQVLAHNLVSAKGVLVPGCIAYEDFSSKLQGRSYMVVKDIGGESLEKQIGELGVIKDNELINQIVFEAGRQLAIINTIPVRGFGKISREQKEQKFLFANEKNFQKWLEKFVSKVEKLKEQEILNKKYHSWILDKYYVNKDLLNYQESFLAHGDFDLTHVYSDGEKFTGIIDFGDMRGGSIYHDMAHFRYYSGDYLDILIQGYQSKRDLDDNFNKRIQIEGLVVAVDEFWRWSNILKHVNSEKIKYGQQLFFNYLEKMTV